MVLQIRSILTLPLLLYMVLLWGCSVQPPSYDQTPGLASDVACIDLLTAMTQRIRNDGVEQGWGAPLHGYPYLRSNRFLASFRTELDTEGKRSEWWQRLWDLGYESRQLQLNNLNPPLSRTQRMEIETCLSRLALADRQHPLRWQEILKQSRVPDSYSDGMRVAGLFPFTRLPVLRVISNEQAGGKLAFNNSQFLTGPSTTYRPLITTKLLAEDVAIWIRDARNSNSLAIPALTDTQLEKLFAHHMPAWRLYYESEADKIGAVEWHDEKLKVNTKRPVIYLLPSYSRFKGEVLLQLNYLVWFPARAPESGDRDPYSGFLDGLIWRVSLASDGTVMAYDSIHPCGCYHKLYPVSKKIEISHKLEIIEAYEEIPLILDKNIPDSGEGRILIHIYPGNHYVVGLTSYQPGDNDISLSSRSYLSLMSLSAGEQGSRSLYDKDGLIRASQRGERYFLWPMGVKSAGAMRQWGHHAISFTGKRHFDDPYLLQQFLDYRMDTTLSTGK